MSPRQRWFSVGIFAMAMGYLEAAVVLYLRTLVHRIQPHQPDPLPDIPGLAAAELGRELATMIMLAVLGWLAGRTWRGRIGFALLAFGIWDISYYIFLVPLTGWPASILDWDILFLIPLPWWGPVWSPMSIAFLMICFGLLSTVLEQSEPPIWPGKAASLIAAAGIILALYVFMADAIAALPQGEEAVRKTVPIQFKTALFTPAWAMMSAPVISMGAQFLRRYHFR